MILTTQRLVLRPTTRSDASALFGILGDPETMAYWHRGPLPRLATVEAQLEDELAAMRAGAFWYWTVLRNGDAIGSIDLSDSDGLHAWTGFAFRRDVWGHGLAREALAAVIAQAFGVLGLIGLQARVQSGNTRAIRLLTALEFQERGALPDVTRDGERRACVRYRLDKSATAKGR